MEVQTLRLDNLEAQIALALSDNAALIYWQHQLGHFSWLRASDKTSYHGELKNLRQCVKNGSIVGVRAGGSLRVKDKTLYPMEVEFCGRECHAYMLICRRGLLEDAISTPYLFVSLASRDKAVTYLSK